MRHFYCLLLLAFSLQLNAQYVDTLTTYDPRVDKVYKVNPWISSGIALAGVLTNDIGLKRLRRQDPLDQATLDGLGPDDVPPIDRWALRQDIDKIDKAEDVSDLGFRIGLIAPFALFIDKRIRKDFVDVTAMYLMTQSLASNFYTWGPMGPTFVQRYRPVAWYTDLPTSRRAMGNVRNSFFSGHVSVTATGSYFAAKVFSDYHPDMNFGQKAIVYTLATAAPVWVGINRVRGLRHFPSDALIGLGVGAFFGTMVPQIHKNWQKKHRTKLGMTGVYNSEVKGMGLSLTF